MSTFETQDFFRGNYRKSRHGFASPQSALLVAIASISIIITFSIINIAAIVINVYKL